MRTILRWLLGLLYGFRSYGDEVLDAPGPVVLLPNHVSWWDWLLIGVCLEKDWRFVTSKQSAETSWLHKRIMVNRRTFQVDMASPYAVKRMAEYLQGGGRLVLFPEGRLSRSGALMKLFDGIGFLINKTQPKIIVAYLRNAEFLPLCPNPNRKQLFPRLSAHFRHVRIELPPPGTKTSKARAHIMGRLRRQMTQQQFEVEMQFGPATLPSAIAQAAEGRKKRIALQDATMQSISYARLLAGAHLLGVQWKKLLPAKERRIGVLLPNMSAMPVTLLALWAGGRIPAILNYSTGIGVLLACARLAELESIITSRKFLEGIKLDPIKFTEAGIKTYFLEDVRGGISGWQKLSTGIRGFFGSPLQVEPVQPQETAVILFTSGSEGNPKGVELTHQNLLANIRQMLSVVDLLETDRFFNALPLFHSFGLTIGLLLPLIRGVFVFLYVSPLHYRVVPSAFYDLDCTVFFGTNTFLAGYARKAHQYDFNKMRCVFAAGEKLQEATANVWSREFGVRLLEGYGATECSPCLSVNTRMDARSGSAGKFLPGIDYRLETVEGVGNAPQKDENAGEPSGRLFVRGPNVMRGYINPDANAAFKALGGWYDTGDIVRVDSDGYLFILGRMKRFAKISGEMVSLTAVEDALAGAFPQFGVRFAAAVISRPDEAKGERLLAITNEPKLTIEDMRRAIHARGLSNLAVPREIRVLHEIPKLGTGKINHRELARLIAEEKVPPTSQPQK